MERIFEPYFTTAEVGKNKGLGLYLAKTIVEKSLGGTLTYSEAAGGSTFLVTI
jgi:signal transduction histidine kinase